MILLNPPTLWIEGTPCITQCVMAELEQHGVFLTICCQEKNEMVEPCTINRCSGLQKNEGSMVVYMEIEFMGQHACSL